MEASSLKRLVATNLRNGLAQLERSEHRGLRRFASGVTTLITPPPKLPDLAFVRTADLAALTCPACDSGETYVAPYPYPATKRFAGLLSVWCTRCGFGWVPTVPFSLANYYAKEYADINRRGDRALDPKAYFEMLSGPEENLPRSYRRYVRRARYQVEQIEKLVTSPYTLLDFGSGPGYGSYFSNASVKHAVELDDHSAKYLAYQNVLRVELEQQRDNTYDVILSSHCIEHVEIQHLVPTLSELWRVLKPGGIMFIEVPSGCYLASYLKDCQEPHTLFFSVGSLRRIVERCGFETIRAYARAKSKRPALGKPLCSQEYLEQAHNGGQLTLIARKVESRDPPIIPALPNRVATRAPRVTPRRR